MRGSGLKRESGAGIVGRKENRVAWPVVRLSVISNPIVAGELRQARLARRARTTERGVSSRYDGKEITMACDRRKSVSADHSFSGVLEIRTEPGRNTTKA